MPSYSSSCAAAVIIVCVGYMPSKIGISAAVILLSPWELYTTVPGVSQLPTLLDLNPSPQLCRHFGHHVSRRPSP